MRLDAPFALRFGAVALLVTAAVLLFIFSRPTSPAPPRDAQRAEDLPVSLPAIDRAVDSVLKAFDIDKRSLRTVSYPMPHSTLKRIEKKVDVPPAFSSIQVNHALNQVAKEYGGRVVASENLKERLVTLHLELGGTIVETVILKTKPDPAPEPSRRKRRSS